MLRSIVQKAALAAFLCSAATCVYAAVPTKTADTSLGKTLVNSDGMTLYTFAKDTTGKSSCTGACEKNWKPLAASASGQAGDNYTMIKRDDGSMQWAYKGMPLYTFVKDAKPGDVAGEGLLKGAWHAAKP
jgi:predicted lipoprotein with Yx(FWY)xxD motif